MPTEPALGQLDLQDLIARVYADWDTITVDAAVYLNALDVNDCRDMDDPVGNETAEIQVRYFLSSAALWRGPAARAIKAELRRRIA